MCGKYKFIYRKNVALYAGPQPAQDTRWGEEFSLKGLNLLNYVQ